MTPTDLALRARQIMAEECMQQAFADMRERLVKKLESPTPNDTVPEHELVLSLQLLVNLRRQLMAYEQEQVIIKHREEHESFIGKTMQRIGRMAR
jgi:hypothetical protein